MQEGATTIDGNADAYRKLKACIDATRPHRIVGHPDLATFQYWHARGGLYVSVGEAVRLEMEGYPRVEVRLRPEREDDEAVRFLRRRSLSHRKTDALPDGWYGPVYREPYPFSGDLA